MQAISWLLRLLDSWLRRLGIQYRVAIDHDKEPSTNSVRVLGLHRKTRGAVSKRGVEPQLSPASELMQRDASKSRGAKTWDSPNLGIISN